MIIHQVILKVFFVFSRSATIYNKKNLLCVYACKSIKHHQLVNDNKINNN